VATLLDEAHEKNDRRARLALDIFCYRARKYIGAYLAAMNGADAIVFTRRYRRKLCGSARRNLRRSVRAGNRTRSGT